MHIRPFQPSDMPALIDLTVEVFGPFYEKSFRSMVPPDVFVHQHGSWADDYRESVPKLHNPNADKHVVVAEADTGEIAGYVGWVIDRQRRHGEIDTVAVRVSARRNGVGRALCEHVLSAMSEQCVE